MTHVHAKLNMCISPSKVPILLSFSHNLVLNQKRFDICLSEIDVFSVHHECFIKSQWDSRYLITLITASPRRETENPISVNQNVWHVHSWPQMLLRLFTLPPSIVINSAESISLQDLFPISKHILLLIKSFSTQESYYLSQNLQHNTSKPNKLSRLKDFLIKRRCARYITFGIHAEQHTTVQLV